MATKQIFEGARRFKPALAPDPNSRLYAESPRGGWRWPVWPRMGLRQSDPYLIDIKPRRLPRA
jgi:hypothetical protein